MAQVLGKRVQARMQREHLRGYPYSLSSFKKVMHELHGLGRWPFRKVLLLVRVPAHIHATPYASHSL